MSHKEPKNIFVKGAIKPEKIAESISKHQSKTGIGAHSLFLGQVRADVVDNRKVSSIDYTAYEEMAATEMHTVREEAFSRYDLTCAHIYHSLGDVGVGEICLFIFTSSPHRQSAIEACNFLLEAIKTRVPIYGKEKFEDETYQWKVNH